MNAPHFQRFRYRVKRFADLLGPDLVHVAQPEQLGALRINDPEVRLTINVANGSCTADMRSTEKSEAEIEKAFVRKDSLPRQLLRAHLKLDKLDRQFPVGVFDGEPTRDGRIFAGGKSAVDLIGLDADKALHLFELKVDGNISVGAVSELSFYAMVIHDLKAGRIAFSQKKVGARMSLTKDDVRGAQSIHAKLFANDFHPLITPEMLKLLSDGARRLGWPINFDMLKLEPFLNPDG